MKCGDWIVEENPKTQWYIVTCPNGNKHTIRYTPLTEHGILWKQCPWCINEKIIYKVNAIAATSQDERYKRFVILDNPVEFKDLFIDHDIPCVQLHSLHAVDNIIVGFCGVFKWENNEIIPLDGDSYNKHVLVYGYEWFDQGIDILVGDDW